MDEYKKLLMDILVIMKDPDYKWEEKVFDQISFDETFFIRKFYIKNKSESIQVPPSLYKLSQESIGKLLAQA